MAELRPFAGVRYNPAIVGSLSSVVSAPYDVISPSARLELEQRSPYNVVRLELGAELPTDAPDDNRYTRAAALYGAWRRRQVVRIDPTPGFYVYDEEFDVGEARMTRRSLVAAVRLADWADGVVFPHEHTLPRAKADRLSLLSATRTQFSPLLATFDDPGGVATALSHAVAGSAPLAEFRLARGAVPAAAEGHRVWGLTSEPLVSELSGALAGSSIYIADGHHRYETALTYRDSRRKDGALAWAPSEYVLIALVEMNDPGLLVLPTHRLLRDLGDLDGREILRRLGQYFEIERRLAADDRARASGSNGSPGTADPATFAVLGLERGCVHRLRLRRDVDLGQALPDVPDVLRDVDTLILQRLIFEAVLGLSAIEAEAGERIQYTRDPEEATRAFEEGQAQLVFFLNPTPLAQIRAAARDGSRMPQKTTYFFPKPVTGVVFFDHQAAW